MIQSYFIACDWVIRMASKVGTRNVEYGANFGFYKTYQKFSLVVTQKNLF